MELNALSLQREKAAIEYDQERDRILRESSNVLRVPPDKLQSTVSRFFIDWKDLGKKNAALTEQYAKLLPSLLRLKHDIEPLQEAIKTSLTSEIEEFQRNFVQLQSQPELLTKALQASTPPPEIKKLQSTLAHLQSQFEQLAKAFQVSTPPLEQLAKAFQASTPPLEQLKETFQAQHLPT